MVRLSILFYSTYFERGWKSSQLSKVVNEFDKRGELEAGYGICRASNSHPKLYLSRVPMMTARVISRLSFLPFIKDYYGYVVGEMLTGLFYAKSISRDSSNVVYVKPRPSMVLDRCKKNDKKIVMEFGELHPYETRELLQKEYSDFDMNVKYIFTSDYAIEDSVKSIDLADIIVVLSKASYKSFLKWGVPKERLRVINLGVAEPAKLKSSLTEIDKEYAFISTAKHSFVKGTHRLLLAWREAAIPNMKLYIAGDLSDDIIDFIKREGPFDNVIYTGAIDVATVYPQKNFIGILNSVAEGYARSVIEYLANGFPVIVTPVSTCDVVQSGINGYIVNSQEELIEKLKYFSTSYPKYSEYSSNAINSAEGVTTDKYVRELHGLIEEVCNEN